MQSVLINTSFSLSLSNKISLGIITGQTIQIDQEEKLKEVLGNRFPLLFLLEDPQRIPFN